MLERKVTVGFKCFNQVKFRLVNEAKDLGLTVSEYVEIIIENRDLISPTEGNDRIGELKKRLAFYENSTLKEIFQKQKGKSFSFFDSNGQKQVGQINSLQDTYQIILSLAKNSKL